MFNQSSSHHCCFVANRKEVVKKKYNYTHKLVFQFKKTNMSLIICSINICVSDFYSSIYLCRALIYFCWLIVNWLKVCLSDIKNGSAIKNWGILLLKFVFIFRYLRQQKVSKSIMLQNQYAYQLFSYAFESYC